MLGRAGERAGSLGAPEEGQRYFERAAELADEPSAQAQLLEQAADGLHRGEPVGRGPGAPRAGDRALRGGGRHAGCRARQRRARRRRRYRGRLDEAAARLEQAVAALDEGSRDAVLAGALAQLGRMHVLAGHERARRGARSSGRSPLAERLQLPEVFVEALTSKAVVLIYRGRPGRGTHPARGRRRPRPRRAAVRERATRRRTTLASCSPRPPTATPKRSKLMRAVASASRAGAATAAGSRTSGPATS